MRSPVGIRAVILAILSQIVLYGFFLGTFAAHRRAQGNTAGYGILSHARAGSALRPEQAAFNARSNAPGIDASSMLFFDEKMTGKKTLRTTAAPSKARHVQHLLAADNLQEVGP